MATITVHAGDFKKGSGSKMYFGQLVMAKPGLFATETIGLQQIEAVEVASEESIKKLGGTVGWGLAGAAILGPVGLLAGLLAGGRKTEVTFVAKFKDGRKFLGSTDAAAFRKIRAAAF